jgi:membrane protein DedA with SNARE-associated domain/rhodanese-related sulfurtransferase
MDVIGLIAHHGYAVTGIILFSASAGLPLPMAVALLAAGAAAHVNLQLGLVFLVAWLSALTGDTLLFLGGKYSGWWILSAICRFSVNPEQCIFSSADTFYRRGARILLITKFIPGLGTVAAPLAGSLNMRLSRFLRLMAIGDALYCATWITAGYLFYKVIRMIVAAIESAGHALLLLVVILAAGYSLGRLILGLRSRRNRKIETITAEDLRAHLNAITPDRLVLIADVRSHNYYDPGMQRIANSIRLEPNRLQEEVASLQKFLAPECEIYLYCSCIRDTTSMQVSDALRKANYRTTVIKGGIKAWTKAGGALEAVPEEEVSRLPRFD